MEQELVMADFATISQQDASFVISRAMPLRHLQMAALLRLITISGTVALFKVLAILHISQRLRVVAPYQPLHVLIWQLVPQVEIVPMQQSRVDIHQAVLCIWAKVTLLGYVRNL